MTNIKHCEQNIQVEITNKMQSSVHKRFLQKNGGNSKKALKKKLREFCLHLLGLREAAPTTNNTEYFTRHFESKWLIR